MKKYIRNNFFNDTLYKNNIINSSISLNFSNNDYSNFYYNYFNIYKNNNLKNNLNFFDNILKKNNEIQKLLNKNISLFNN
jgi:hypothetical protein